MITGFYNRASVLERTIESILNQTFQDFELIVFDDKSTDGTAERLAELSALYNDPRFRYTVHEQNKGFVCGLRDAIAQTTGEYIAIQGSGDASLPKRLELQVALLDERPDVGVVGGWYSNVQEDQGIRRLRSPNADDAGLNDFLKTNFFSHGEVMIRRNVYNAVGGYRVAFKYAQDRDLWLRIAKVSRFATVPEPVYDRYVQFDGVSYVASKIVSQACYSVAAARLAQMSPAQEAEALARIEASGPIAVIGTDDATVQKKIVNAAIRMVLFGSPAGEVEIARSHILSPMVRNVLGAFGSIFDSPVSAPLRFFVRSAVGMKGGS
ncbi:glycosyltransferase [Arthrobacter sp. NPDC089319]|uniref:glycosyltransferase n=1 Tax=Arthrobacter sp. NPDC089319 TaxID=3155915 RepID=UPI00343AD1E8